MESTFNSEPRIADLERDPSEYSFAAITQISWLFGGIIFSGIMLALSKPKCRYVRFQVAQCFAAQIAWMILAFVLSFGFFIILAIIAGIMDSSGATNTQGGDVLAGLMGMIFIGAPCCLYLFQIVTGIWAMVSVSKGADFTIPLIGNLVFSWFFKREMLEAFPMESPHGSISPYSSTPMPSMQQAPPPPDVYPSAAPPPRPGPAVPNWPPRQAMPEYAPPPDQAGNEQEPPNQ